MTNDSNTTDDHYFANYPVPQLEVDENGDVRVVYLHPSQLLSKTKKSQGCNCCSTEKESGAADLSE